MFPSFIFQPLAPSISTDSKADEEQLNNTSTTDKESDGDDDSDYVNPYVNHTAQLKPDENCSATTNANVGNLHEHGQTRGCRGHGRGRRRRGHGTRGGIRGCECGGC